MIEFKKVCKAYQVGDNKIEVLKEVDLFIDRHELVSIMGESGSGKSTLMNIIGLLDTPTSGAYRLNAREIIKLSDNERSQIRNETIGFVFQSFFLLPRLTALQNVALPFNYRKKVAKDEIHQRCLSMLAKVGMKEYATRRPNELSGGQQQRVAIARALVGKPSVILADEPTGALDSKTSQEVMELFIHLNQEEKTSVIVITHDPKVAQQCQRTIHIRDGQVHQ